jgi:hypothetical protein
MVRRRPLHIAEPWQAPVLEQHHVVAADQAAWLARVNGTLSELVACRS